MILRINTEYFPKHELTGIFNGDAEIICDVGTEFWNIIRKVSGFEVLKYYRSQFITALYQMHNRSTQDMVRFETKQNPGRKLFQTYTDERN
jgi:hypothetical protein